MTKSELLGSLIKNKNSNASAFDTLKECNLINYFISSNIKYIIIKIKDNDQQIKITIEKNTTVNQLINYLR